MCSVHYSKPGWGHFLIIDIILTPTLTHTHTHTHTHRDTHTHTHTHTVLPLSTLTLPGDLLNTHTKNDLCAAQRNMTECSPWAPSRHCILRPSCTPLNYLVNTFRLQSVCWDNVDLNNILFPYFYNEVSRFCFCFFFFYNRYLPWHRDGQKWAADQGKDSIPSIGQSVTRSL